MIAVGRSVFKWKKALELLTIPSRNSLRPHEGSKIRNLELFVVLKMTHTKRVRELLRTHTALETGAHEHEQVLGNAASVREHGWKGRSERPREFLDNTRVPTAKCYRLFA